MSTMQLVDVIFRDGLSGNVLERYADVPPALAPVPGDAWSPMVESSSLGIEPDPFTGFYLVRVRTFRKFSSGRVHITVFVDAVAVDVRAR